MSLVRCSKNIRFRPLSRQIPLFRSTAFHVTCPYYRRQFYSTPTESVQNASQAANPPTEPTKKHFATWKYLIALPILLIIYALISIFSPILLQKYTLKLDIDNSDPSFQWFIYWLSQLEYSRDCTHLSVFSLRNSAQAYNWLLSLQQQSAEDEDADSSKLSNDACRITNDEILIPAPGPHIFKYKGHWIYLHYDKEPASKPNQTKTRENITIWVLNHDRKNLVDLIKEARDMYEQQKHNRISIYMPDTHMLSWEEVERKEPRKLDTIILQEGLMESLQKDLETFKSRKAFYREKGIPFRRGYLLYGIPGSGKTSTVLALAGHYAHNICLLNIGAAAMNDETLNHLLTKAPKNSFILLEDIDACVASVNQSTSRGRQSGVYHSQHDDDEEDVMMPFFDHNSDSKVTLSGLLNVLDGVHSKEGRIIFCTSNHPEHLQPALIRPGRIDFRMQIGYADENQIRDLFQYFYSNDANHTQLEQLSQKFVEYLRRNPEFKNIAPSTLSSYFLTCSTPEEAVTRAQDLFKLQEL